MNTLDPKALFDMYLRMRDISDEEKARQMITLKLEANISCGEGPEFITVSTEFCGEFNDIKKSGIITVFATTLVSKMKEIYYETDGEGGDYSYITITLTQFTTTTALLKLTYDYVSSTYSLIREV